MAEKAKSPPMTPDLGIVIHGEPARIGSNAGSYISLGAKVALSAHGKLPCELHCLACDVGPKGRVDLNGCSRLPLHSWAFSHSTQSRPRFGKD